MKRFNLAIALLFVATLIGATSCKNSGKSETAITETSTSTGNSIAIGDAVAIGDASAIVITDTSISIAVGNGADIGEVTTEIPVTSISIDSDNFDFGEISDNETIVHPFIITNTGETPLIIYDSHTSCNCTTVKLPEESIAPGDSAKIDVSFNSSGRTGFQLKEITIFANVEKGSFKLYFSANIK